MIPFHLRVHRAWSISCCCPLVIFILIECFFLLGSFSFPRFFLARILLTRILYFRCAGPCRGSSSFGGRAHIAFVVGPGATTSTVTVTVVNRAVVIIASAGRRRVGGRVRGRCLPCPRRALSAAAKGSELPGAVCFGKSFDTRLRDIFFLPPSHSLTLFRALVRPLFCRFLKVIRLAEETKFMASSLRPPAADEEVRFVSVRLVVGIINACFFLFLRSHLDFVVSPSSLLSLSGRPATPS